MRQITKTTSLYKFSELSEEAKLNAKAWHNYANSGGYAWADEALDSLRALADRFGGKLSQYQIDYFGSSYSSASFDMPELEPHEIGSTLFKLGSFNSETLKGLGDCVLTGYCADEDAIDGFRAAFRAGERDMDKLMQAAFQTWLKAAQADCADQYSDEMFSDHCDSNDYEFTEDGNLYK